MINHTGEFGRDGLTSPLVARGGRVEHEVVVLAFPLSIILHGFRMFVPLFHFLCHLSLLLPVFQRVLQLAEGHGQDVFDRGVGDVVHSQGRLDAGVDRLARQIAENVQWITGPPSSFSLFNQSLPVLLHVRRAAIHLTHFESKTEILSHNVVDLAVREGRPPTLLFHLLDHATRLVLDRPRVRKHGGGIRIFRIRQRYIGNSVPVH
mmetsp:Transcript_14861/g.32412  ORF Transcript_14861/g.32412 Transcript_14861/m.32412 type:complete len:206 (-) Transcript_14861:1173-1790(-)